MHRRLKLSLILGLSCLILPVHFIGCGNRKAESENAKKPAEVTNQVKESTLTTIRLSAEAENRLGIETRRAEITKYSQNP